MDGAGKSGERAIVSEVNSEYPKNGESRSNLKSLNSNLKSLDGYQSGMVGKIFVYGGNRQFYMIWIFNFGCTDAPQNLMTPSLSHPTYREMPHAIAHSHQLFLPP